MNYLAHLLLAENTDESLLGNLMADFVKGSAHLALPPGIQRGIRLHRRVDAFTDSHPLVQRSIARISPRWGWFSGIILDVYFDYLLAADWQRYSTVALRDFIDHAYAVMQRHLDILPEEMREAVTRIIGDDRLMSYSQLDGIAHALTRISDRLRKRTSRPDVRLEEALPDLALHHGALRDNFREFFPELIRHVEKVRQEEVIPN
jgi:acyl carrier protein phosphodiesterase